MAKEMNTEGTASGSGMSGALGGTPKPEDEDKDKSFDPGVGSSTAPATIGGGGTSPSVKAMPKQQKAGTGTFANLKSYLQAAQGGGRVSQAATQRVQNVAGQAQQGIGKAQEAFRTRMQTGSGAAFRGTEPDKYLTEAQAAEQARARTESVLGTARGVTYQAPQKAEAAPETQQAEIPATAQPQAPAQAQQYFTPIEQQQFADIINAQYEGPESLQQAGLYEQAARKAQTAQQALQQAQTAGGREQLLRDIFGRSRDYSRGQSKLDALLLNTSQQGVQSLQEQAQKAGNVQQQLQEAQNLSANEAARRAEAIQGIASGARTAFTEARTAEETAANDRIKAIQDNWNKLPEYFKNLLTESKATGQTTARVGEAMPSQIRGNAADWNRFYDEKLGTAGLGTTYNLSQEEAAILGLTPGAGLYGLNPEMVQATTLAGGAELITKDQLSRQLALAELAKLDTSKGLEKALTYSDLEKAGTKDVLSSLNVSSIQKQMLEKQKEMEKALSGKKAAISTKLGSGKYDWGYVPYSYLDLIKQGGYTESDMAGLIPEDVAQTNLRAIAEGREYTPIENAQQASGYVQQALKNLAPKTVLLQSIDALQKAQAEMKKYGAQDTIQLAEDEKTKARASALRSLLGDIYK